MGGEDLDLMAVFGRSVILLGDDWLARRAERSFRAAQRALDEWHRFMTTVPASNPRPRDDRAG